MENAFGFLTLDHYPIMIPISVYESIQVMNYQVLHDFNHVTDT